MIPFNVDTVVQPPAPPPAIVRSVEDMGLAEGNALLEKAVAEREAFVEAFLAEEARLAHEAIIASRLALYGSHNAYPVGQCTNHAKSRRMDVPNHLGDARFWFNTLKKLGWETGETPRARAIGVAKRGNHVIFVERVNPDGTIYLSERNWDYRGSYRERTADASLFRYVYE